MTSLNTKKPKIATLLLFLLVASLEWQVSAASAAARSFQISPPVLEVALAPGSVQESTITVTNMTDDLVSLEAFVRDFVAGPDGDEPRILGEDETSPFSLKNWLLSSQKNFVLAAKEEKTVTVTIAVPNGAEPGGHYGLVGFTEPNSEIGEGVGVKAGIATLFLVTVEGQLTESGTITRFRGPGLNVSGRVPLALSVKNTGNVHLVPQGFIRITNLFGNQVAELPVNAEGDLVLPASERAFSSTWAAISAFGYYRAQATVYFSETGNQAVSPAITIWVFPARTLAIGILSLVILILVGYEIEHVLVHRRQARVREA